MTVETPQMALEVLMSVSSMTPRECITCGTHMNSQELYCQKCKDTITKKERLGNGEYLTKMKDVSRVHQQPDA